MNWGDAPEKQLDYTYSPYICFLEWSGRVRRWMPQLLLLNNNPQTYTPLTIVTAAGTLTLIQIMKPLSCMWNLFTTSWAKFAKQLNLYFALEIFFFIFLFYLPWLSGFVWIFIVENQHWINSISTTKWWWFDIKCGFSYERDIWAREHSDIEPLKWANMYEKYILALKTKCVYFWKSLV